MANRKQPLEPRSAIRQMDPYRPPSSGRGGKMRLDFNENTVGCSPRVVARLRRIRREDLSVYPEYQEALPKFAAYFDVAPDQLTLTNGTDEAIQLVVHTYVGEGDPVLIPRPTYAMYRFYCQLAGARVAEVDYRADGSFPGRELLRRLSGKTRGVFIANPNNPTGTSASAKQLEAILQAASQAAVLVDEAYFEFSGQTVLPWIARYPNLFVSRTFSKAFGLAALRLGCLFSQRQNMEILRKGQSPYSVNAAAVAAGLEAIRDAAYVKRYVGEVLRAREMLCGELARLGWNYFPSDANFVLVNFGKDVRVICDLLREEQLLVRDRSYELPGCLRITVGTMAQTKKLIRSLRRFAPTRGRIPRRQPPASSRKAATAESLWP